MVDRRLHCGDFGFTRDEVRLMFYDGHARSLRMLIDAGLVKEK
jgi:hypothetical protein